MVKSFKTRIAAGLVVLGLAIGLPIGLSGGGHPALPAGISFQATFDSGTVQSAFNTTAQCANIQGHQNPGASHYLGDVYQDTGGSSSSTPGSNFNLAGNHTVPAGQGTASARFVVPVTPSGYGRTSCALLPSKSSVLQNLASPNDIGQTKWYGIMVYAPVGEQIGNTSDPQGEILWEYHFNAISGNSFSIGLVARGGTGGWAITGSIESGACALGSATIAVTGCTYRSHSTSCSTFHPAPMFGQPIHCIQGPLYVMTPGQLKQGVWYEVIVGIKWATGPTGSITTEYRSKGTSTWTQGWSGSGFPTVQWNGAIYGGLCSGSTACGYPSHEAVQYYGPHEVGNAYSFNVDNVVVGSSLSAVQSTMP